MKNLKFIQILILLVSLCSCNSCEEEEWTTLPPETQTGANTFGCYVNEKLFVKGNRGAPFMHPRLTAVYDKDLIIDAYSTEGQNIYMEMKDPKVNVSCPIFVAYLMPRGQRQCFCFSGTETGEMILTKLDTINHIVSGRFYFRGQCSDPSFEITGDSIISITNGRFDIKLDIY